MYENHRRSIISKTIELRHRLSSNIDCVIIKLFMLDNESSSLFHSLRKTKTVLLAVSLTPAGLLIIMLSR